MDYTTTALISRVKKDAAIPANQPGYDNTTLLRFLTDKMHTLIVPFIMNINEEYFVEYSDYSITGASDTTFAIPSNAILSRLREVKLYEPTSDPNVWTIYNLPRTSIDDLEWKDRGFYIEGNNVVLVMPENYSGKKLRIYYYYRPNELVETSAAAQVATVTPSTSVTVTSVPSSWGATETVDAIKGTPHFDNIANGITATIASTTLTFSTYPTGIAVGDWISLAGTSPVAQIPYETYPLLCQAAIIKILEAQSDVQGSQMAAATYKEMREHMMYLLSPRVKGEAIKIKNRRGFDTWRNNWF